MAGAAGVRVYHTTLLSDLRDRLVGNEDSLAVVEVERRNADELAHWLTAGVVEPLVCPVIVVGAEDWRDSETCWREWGAIHCVWSVRKTESLAPLIHRWYSGRLARDTQEESPWASLPEWCLWQPELPEGWMAE